MSISAFLYNKLTILKDDCRTHGYMIFCMGKNMGKGFFENYKKR